LVRPYRSLVEIEEIGSPPRPADVADTLKARDMLSTDYAGHATALVFYWGICGLESDSRTQLLPDGADGERLHEPLAGATTCISFSLAGITVGTSLGTFRSHGSAIRTEIEEDGGLTVRVYEGRGVLQSAEGGQEPVEIQAGEEASIDPGGFLSEPVRFDLTPNELETLRSLRDSLLELGEEFTDPLIENPSLSLEVSFSVGPLDIEVGTPVEFTAIDIVGAEYSWDFGDGSSDQGMSVTHIYLSSGVFPVTLTTTTEEGIEGTTTTQVMVKGGPSIPPTTPTACGGPLEIVLLDKVGELVEIKNQGVDAVAMTGWQLVSVRGSQGFFFLPGFVLDGGAVVSVTSGPDAVNEPPETLRWTTRFVWNNTEPDPATLFDACGQLISEWPD